MTRTRRRRSGERPALLFDPLPDEAPLEGAGDGDENRLAARPARATAVGVDAYLRRLGRERYG